MTKNVCIIRNTYGDRSPFLQLSLEYQDKASNSQEYRTFIFIDPNPDYGINSNYNSEYFNKYPKIVFENHKQRRSWYLATKYIFDNYDFDYIISIEDDIIISQDYFRICNDIIKDNILDTYSNVLFFHIGAWEEPKGSINRIVYSGVSSRSILINRNKFNYIKEYVEKLDTNTRIGNDAILSSILKANNMKTIAPLYNRHGHFGIYGWSSLGIHADNKGQKSLFDKEISHKDLYELLKKHCFNGEELSRLNQYKNPKYFWNFDPNVNFTKLEYSL